MSEYWVSHKKYFCKYCDIYISDDAPSRRQHEGGLRHKGNTERFIRGLYKAGEKRKKDLDEEKRDMARIEQAAQAAFAQDVGSGHAKASSSKLAPPTPAVIRKPAQMPSNAFVNYSTAESLGYKDPDADRLLAEAQRRRAQGVAGDWEIVTPSPAPEPTPSAPIPSTADEETSRKREAEAMHDDERLFKLRKKTLTTGLGEIYDPGIIPIKLKKKEEPAEVDNLAPTDSQVTAAPKWTTLHWKPSGEPNEKESKQEPEGNGAFAQEVQDKPFEQQSPSLQTVTENKIPVKSEETPSASSVPEEAGSLFRKRKTPATGGKGRRHT